MHKSHNNILAQKKFNVNERINETQSVALTQIYSMLQYCCTGNGLNNCFPTPIKIG